MTIISIAPLADPTCTSYSDNSAELALERQNANPEAEAYERMWMAAQSVNTNYSTMPMAANDPLLLDNIWYRAGNLRMQNLNLDVEQIKFFKDFSESIADWYWIATAERDEMIAVGESLSWHFAK